MKGLSQVSGMTAILHLFSKLIKKTSSPTIVVLLYYLYYTVLDPSSRLGDLYTTEEDSTSSRVHFPVDVRSAFGVLAVSIPMAIASRVEYESSKVEKRKLNGKQF